MIHLKRFILLSALVVVLATAVHGQEAAGAGPVEGLIQNMTSEDAAVRLQAFQALQALGEEGLPQLLGRLVEPGQGDDAGVRLALHGFAAHVARPGAEAERAAFVQALTAHLATDAPPGVKRFVIEQLQIAGRAECVAALAACLADAELAESARQALLANPTDAATKALRDALPKAEGLVRVGLIQALGQRRDVAAVPALLQEAARAEADVRLAALESLGRIGDLRAEPVLAAALGQGTPAEQRIAFDAYLRLGEGLLAAGKRTDAGKVYTRALQAASAASQRVAALLGVGQAGGAEVVNTVLPYTTEADPLVRRAALDCLTHLSDPKVSPALAEAMRTAQPSLKAALLHVLAQRKEPEATEAIEAATQDPSAEVRVTAFQLLGRLDDPALEETLLEAATDGSDAVHPVALEAYLRLAEGRLGRHEEDAALDMVRRALGLARTDPLRRLALRGLAQVARPEALPQVEPLLADEAVRDDALRAYVAIAGAVAEAGEKERGIAMLRRALELGPPRDVTQTLVEKLRGLGVQVDPARSAGFVSAWHIIGPFSGTEVDQPFPPEQAVDLQGTVPVDGRELRWVKHQVADIMGVVDLLALMQPNENVTAYLYAEVRVEAAQDVLFKMGSDDSLKCWLNGQLLHRYPQPRSLTVDQDTVPAHLNAGVNQILLKVVNFGGGWGCCLRITSPDGKPIAFEQPEG